MDGIHRSANQSGSKLPQPKNAMSCRSQRMQCASALVSEGLPVCISFVASPGGVVYNDSKLVRGCGRLPYPREEGTPV